MTDEFEYTFRGKKSGVLLGRIFTWGEMWDYINKNPSLMDSWILVKRPKTEPWAVVAPEIQFDTHFDRMVKWFGDRDAERKAAEQEDAEASAWRERMKAQLDSYDHLKEGEI